MTQRQMPLLIDIQPAPQWFDAGGQPGQITCGQNHYISVDVMDPVIKAIMGSQYPAASGEAFHCPYVPVWKDAQPLFPALLQAAQIECLVNLPERFV